MTTLRFLLKRFLAQRLLGVAIVVTLGFTIGVLVAGPIYADAAREAILQAEVRTAAVTVANLRLTAYGDPSFPYADADAAVARAASRLPLDALVRQGRGTVRLVKGDAEPLSIAVMFRTGAFGHVPFVGERPEAPGEIALPGSVARLLKIGVGDEIQLLGPTGARADTTVVGTFGRPGPADAGFWYGDQTPFPSETRQPGSLGVAEQFPPALMAQDAYLLMAPDLGVTSEYVWDGYVAYAGLPFEQAQRLPALVTQAQDELRASGATFSGLQVTTGLDTMITLVRQRVEDLRVPIFLVVFQIGAVTLAILAGVGSLVLGRQSFELAVLRSRGFSGSKLMAAQGVQALLTAIVAYPLGLLLGMGLATLASNANGPSLPGVYFPIQLSPLSLVLGLVGATVGAITLLILSVPHIRRTILEERRLLSREDRPLLARVPVELFVLPLALFAFVELRSSAVESTAARDQLEPLVLLAPTLWIFALSFLSLRLLLWVLRRLDRRIGRTRSVPRYLAARRLGRSPGTSFATSLLLVLAVGLLIVSTSYRAIVIRNHEDSAHQQVGADWNVQIAAPEQQLVAADSVPGNAVAVVRTNPVFELPGAFPLTPAAIAVDPARYADGGWWRADYSNVPLERWLDLIEAPDPGVPVTGSEFEATIDAPPAAAGLELLVTYESADGEVRTSSAGVLREGTATYSTTLEGADRLSSIALRREQAGGGTDQLGLAISGATVGEPWDLSMWEPLRWRGSDGTLEPTAAGVALTIDPGAGHVVGGIAPPMAPLPAMVSPEVGRSQGVEFTATMGGQRLRFRRVAVAEAFPSTPADFMVVSTPGLLRAAVRIPEAGLALNEVWAMGDDPRPALEPEGFVIGETQAAGPIIAVLAQLPQSLAVGMNFAAAAGGLGLVVIGVAVGLYFAQRRREFEFASLRAMGTVPRQIARVLLLEQGSMIVFALVAGAAIGFGILRWLMPYVGRSIGAAFPPPVLVVDRVSLAISLSAIVAATAIGLLTALRALLRSSVTSVLRGEAE